MGGHGGLNILPQKRWNVYRFDNIEKVRLDEEAAAKEEQLKREQSRKRDSEFRLEKLRLARGLPLPPASQTGVVAATASVPSEPKSTNHINLFEGLKDFPSLDGDVKGEEESKKKKRKLKKEEVTPKVISLEDEKYRLGYGLAGKGVKAPWYLLRPSNDAICADNGEVSLPVGSGGMQKSGKKTLEELREERLKREKREKERERALVQEKNRKDGAVLKIRGFSRYGM